MFYPEQSSGVGAIKVEGTRIKGVGGPVEGLQAVSRIRTIPASFHSVSSTPATFCCYFNRLPYLDSSRFLSDSQSNSSYVTRGGGRSFVQVHLSRSPLTADHRKPARALSHSIEDAYWKDRQHIWEGRRLLCRLCQHRAQYVRTGESGWLAKCVR